MKIPGALQTAVPEKLGMAALVSMIAHGGRAITITFWLLVGFWIADFVTGILCMLRTGECYDRNKAKNGLLKLFLIPIIGIVAAWIEALFVELPPHVDADGRLILGAYAIIAIDQLQSIGRNLTVFFPGMRPFWGRIVTIIKRSDEETPRVEESYSRVIIQEPPAKKKP